MKRLICTFTTFFAVSMARASDLATTYRFDPALKQEANPLATILHADFSTILLAQILGALVVFVLPLWFYWRYAAKPMPTTPQTLREFASLQIYNRVLTWPEFIYATFFRLPKDWVQAVRYLAVAGSWTIVFASFLAVFSWWAIEGWHWTEYRRIRGLFFIADYPVCELVLDLVFLQFATLAYWKMEFTEFKSGLEKSQ